MQLKKFIKKSAAVVLSTGLAVLFAAAGYYSTALPDSIRVCDDPLRFGAFPGLTAEYVSEDTASVSFMGAIPVKSVAVNHEEPPTLIAAGKPFGIKLLMEGVMVTDIGSVDEKKGKRCPAEEAGICVGDVIRLANGEQLTSNDRLQSIINDSGGKIVELSVIRGNEELNVRLKPAYSEKKEKWQGGMWVRDSIAGIGTMTFIDRSTGQFAGLGHPICDGDTKELVPLHSGEAVPVRITSVKKGVSGIPGELHGKFTGMPSYGTLLNNCGCGVFGSLTETGLDRLGSDAQEYEMGYIQDITEGPAQIIATVSGGTPKLYDAEIEEIRYTGSDETKNMVIRITNEELIAETGGIVQGMSGSPIIQNGRLIGAVTHVFVADPTRGYAVFAETMYEKMTAT